MTNDQHGESYDPQPQNIDSPTTVAAISASQSEPRKPEQAKRRSDHAKSGGKSATASVARDPWMAFRWVFTILVALLAAASLVFPVTARAYAQRVVDSLDNATEAPVVDVPSNTKKNNGLGIRSLPLFNDASIAAVKANDVEQGADAGRALFGDQWDAIYEAGNVSDARGGSFSVAIDNNSVLDNVRDLVRQALSNMGNNKADQVAQTLGLLTWYGDIQSGADRTMSGPTGQLVAAAALALEAPAVFDTCDVDLQAAYYLDLLDWGYSNESVDRTLQAYDKAVAACGTEDATAAVMQTQYQLVADYHDSSSSAIPLVLHSLRNGQLDELDEQAKQLMKDHPTVSGAMLTAGDMYRYLAVLASKDGMGTFTVKYLREQAAMAYETGSKLSTQPELIWALGKIYNNLGEYDKTVSLYSDNEAALTAQGAYGTLAAAKAHTGDFDSAASLQLEQLRETAADVDASEAISIARSTYTEIDMENGILTEIPGSRSLVNYVPRGAGAAVEDLAWYPEYRDDTMLETITADELTIVTVANDIVASSNSASQKLLTEGNSVAALYLQYLYLAGNYDALDSYCDASSSSTSDICSLSSTHDNTLPVASEYTTVGNTTDRLQNLWRRYGNYDKAEAVLRNADDGSYLIDDRLAEIAYLNKDYAKAAGLERQAVDTIRNQYGDSGLTYCGPRQSDGTYLILKYGVGSVLRLATALRMTGDLDAAQEALKSVYVNAQSCGAKSVSSNSSDTSGIGKLDLVMAYAHRELAQIEYARQDYQSAFDDASKAAQLLDSLRNGNLDALVPQRGADEQLASVAAYGKEDYQSALEWSKKAVAFDPHSPLYQEALADAQRAVGGSVSNEESNDDNSSQDQTDQSEQGTDSTSKQVDSKAQMMQAYQEVLESNDSLFSSWNNLGVLQAQTGDTNAAFDSFKHAVAARADYAIGWFNLGVIASEQQGIENFLLAQGALGKASSLDKSLKEQDPVLMFDNEVYQSGLDVSKAIPDDWQLARTMRRNTNMFTIGLALLVVVRVLVSLGQDWISGKVTGKAIPFLEKTGARVSGGHPNLMTRILLSPWLTTVVTLVALMWMSGANAGLEWWMTLLGCVLLLAIPVVATSWVGTGAKPDRHQSFWPASVVTLALAPFGLGFAPPAPMVVDDKNLAQRKEQWSMLLLGLFTVAVCVAGAVTDVPATRLLSAAALVVIGSALTAIPPLDGAKLNPPAWLDWLITALLTASTVLSAMGLL